MTLRLDPGTADQIAKHHDSAVEKIDGAASTAPASVDGGLGASYLMDILAAVIETAAEVSMLNAGVAAHVRGAADDVGLTDEQVRGEFIDMSGLAG